MDGTFDRRSEIEQDADIVLLLHREDYYHVNEEGYVPMGITDLIIEKHRNGPTGVVPLVFRADCTRFESAAPYPRVTFRND